MHHLRLPNEPASENTQEAQLVVGRQSLLISDEEAPPLSPSEPKLPRLVGDMRRLE